jgi:hypothetical protein
MSADSTVARRAEYVAAAVRRHLRGGGKRPGGSRWRRGLARSVRIAAGTAVAIGGSTIAVAVVGEISAAVDCVIAGEGLRCASMGAIYATWPRVFCALQKFMAHAYC